MQGQIGNGINGRVRSKSKPTGGSADDYEIPDVVDACPTGTAVRIVWTNLFGMSKEVQMWRRLGSGRQMEKHMSLIVDSDRQSGDQSDRSHMMG